MSLLVLLEQFKYHLLVPAAIIEGPIITIVAAFLSTLGVFNIYVVYGVSVLADILGDIALYAIGRFGAPLLRTRLGRWLGATDARLKQAETFYREHRRRALVASKLIHGIGGAGLIASGILRTRFSDFLWVIIPTVFVQSGVLLLLGVLFGRAYVAFGHGLNEYAAIGSAVVIAVLLYLGIRAAAQRLLNTR
jgi:membrane protein DedA with SNARE-associated domain